MHNKRDFLKGAAAASIASALPSLALAASPPRVRHVGKPTLAYRNEVMASVQKWLDALDERPYRISYEPMRAIYKLSTTTPYQAHIHGRSRLWAVSLGFSEPITPEMSVNEIQKRLVDLSTEGFRLPGVQHEYWWVRAMPPRSSIEKGITVLEAGRKQVKTARSHLRTGRGHLKIRVRTDFFAVWGRDMRATVVPDKSMPDEAHFEIRKNFSSEIIMTFEVENF